jgi:hypothetical protein
MELEKFEILRDVSVAINDFLNEECNWANIYRLEEKPKVVIQKVSNNLKAVVSTLKTFLLHDIKQHTNLFTPMKPVECLSSLLLMIKDFGISGEPEDKVDKWILLNLQAGELCACVEILLRMDLKKYYKPSSIVNSLEHTDSLQFLLKDLLFITFEFKEEVEKYKSESLTFSSRSVMDYSLDSTSVTSVSSKKKTRKKRIPVVTSVESSRLNIKSVASPNVDLPESFSFPKSYSLVQNSLLHLKKQQSEFVVSSEYEVEDKHEEIEASRRGNNVKDQLKESIVKDKEDEVKDKEDALEDKEYEVEDKEDALEDKEYEVEDKEDVLKDKEDVLKDKEDVLKDKEDILKDKEDIFKEKEEKENTLKDKEDKLKHRVDILKHNVNNQENLEDQSTEKTNESLIGDQDVFYDTNGILSYDQSNIDEITFDEDYIDGLKDTEVLSPVEETKSIWSTISSFVRSKKEEKIEKEGTIGNEGKIEKEKVKANLLSIKYEQSTLTAQEFKCYECKCSIYFPNDARLCNYTGYFYCTVCHQNETSLIPYRILFNWDFTKYPVSHNSKQYLESIHNIPLISINTMNPELSTHVRIVERIVNLQKETLKINQTLCTKDSLFKDKFSIKQLQSSIETETKLHTFNESSKQHIRSCKKCQLNGSICLFCKSADRIFTFEDVKSCDQCNSIFHSKCFYLNDKKCPNHK